MLLGLPSLQAATILVDSEADGSVAAHCTLRDAVAAANTDAAVAGCGAGSGADEIHFAADVASITLTYANGGSLAISAPLTLDGQGRRVALRREASDEVFRIIETRETAPLVLRWMKISGGRLDAQSLYGGGAGVLARGDLSVESSEVSANVTNKLLGRGAGILAHAGLELVDSVVSGNATTGQSSPGGGIYSYYHAVTLTRSIVSANATLETGSQGGGIATRFMDVVATDSTIADNWTAGSASFGGGFYVPLGKMTLIDSTVSGNSTEGANAWGGGGYAYTVESVGSTVSDNSTTGSYAYGGGIFSATADVSNSTFSANATRGEGSLGAGLVIALSSRIRNSTFFANQAELAPGGGLLVSGSDPSVAVNLDSSLLFGNRAAGDADVAFADSEGGGTPLEISGAHNLIGEASATVNVPADTLRCDPRLASLAANGGRTWTHRLGQGSCAIDAGANPDAVATDQRGAGYVRTFGAATDIGAFEWQPADDKVFADGFDAGPS